MNLAVTDPINPKPCTTTNHTTGICIQFEHCPSYKALAQSGTNEDLQYVLDNECGHDVFNQELVNVNLD